jgi:predicted MFS family arabinose efflux permease
MRAVAEGEAVGARAKGMRAPLRHRDFRALAVGLGISQAGDWLYNVALLILVLEATSSATWVAAAGVVRLLPYVLFGTLGGVIADRYPRKRVMIVSDLARAVLMAGLGVVALSSGSPLTAILLAGASTTFAVAYGPSVHAGIPLLVDEDDLSAANAITTTIQNVCIAIGPAVGGVLLLLGSPALAFFFNAVTFLASAVAVALIKKDLGPLETAHEHGEEPSLVERLREGFHAMRGSADVLVLVGAWTANSFLYGSQIVLLTLLATGRLGIGDQGLSFLYAAVGIGGIVAAGLAHRSADRPQQGLALAVSTLITAAAWAAIAFATTGPVAYALAAIDGAATIVLDVLIVTSLQRMLGNEVLGRVMGAVESMVVGGMLLGSIVAAPLVPLIGVQATVLVIASVVAVAGVLVLVRARQIDARAAGRAELLAPLATMLHALDLFEGASRATLEALAEELTLEHVPAGTVVIRQGDEPDDLFIVRDGHLVVTIETKGRVGELAANQYFGEIGLIHRVPRTATVTADVDCDLYRMPGESFLRLLNEGPTQSASLVDNLQTRMATHGPRTDLENQ